MSKKKTTKEKDKLTKQKYTAKKAAKAKKLRKKRIKSFMIFLTCLLILAVLAFGVRFFLFETVKVTTDALNPVYTAGDVVVVNKLMDVSKVKRGDLVYASFSAASDHKLIRRVVGLEDDEIVEREDGKYLVPDDTSPEINLGAAEGLACGKLQAGQYLLLADNMDDSKALDSRQLGLVTSENFIGTPGGIIWPPARAFK